ncbi:MAG: hypothetical protein IPN34_27600 [Planctomycetes bacterium]|nr:hypothetical protein [Planctomycetota bacterium]
MPLLLRARARLGREPTAEIVEWLAAKLHWRPLLAAGPEGASGLAIAQLDVILDVIRECESTHVDPTAVIASLEAKDTPTDDLPVIRLHRDAQVVSVTTVFGAKGLEWDHVALQQIGAGGHDGVLSGKSWQLARPRGEAILGVSIDPERGLDARPGPLSILGKHIGAGEKREESWRLFYVGLTRARRSVTLAIGKADARGKNQLAALRGTFAGDPLGPGVRVLAPADVATAAPSRALVHEPTVRVRPFTADFAKDAGGWTLASPSGRAADDAQLERYRRAARVVIGRPQRRFRRVLGEIPDRVLGEVVHGWLERWAFRGEPPRCTTLRYHLRDRWSSSEASLARWLVALGLGLRDELPGFRELLSHRLHFEWPVLGWPEAGAFGDELLVGRADLVVELPERRLVILDFEAGSRIATTLEILTCASTRTARGLPGYPRGRRLSRRRDGPRVRPWPELGALRELSGRNSHGRADAVDEDTEHTARGAPGGVQESGDPGGRACSLCANAGRDPLRDFAVAMGRECSPASVRPLGPPPLRVVGARSRTLPLDA